MKRALLLAASMALDGIVLAATFAVIGAWIFGLLPAILGVGR